MKSCIGLTEHKLNDIDVKQEKIFNNTKDKEINIVIT